MVEKYLIKGKFIYILSEDLFASIFFSAYS